MRENYNQTRAMLSITKASLRAIFRSPSAVVFSFAFPLIFILIFGFIGGGGRVSFKICLDENSDTLNPVYVALKSVSGITIISNNEKDIKEDLEKGRLTAILNIHKDSSSNAPNIMSIKVAKPFTRV